MIRLRVKEIARAKGFSQGRLSRVANIDENTLKRIYRDPYAIITTETLDKLAKALGVPSAELIEDVPDDKRD
ncbi:MAG: helix-turn-helix transcriptional regulator [Chloroflexi bacterium]|jgi:DNA-binding Xre family transcriptional regulator|nr:MAG: helix-turn-helix transcriptional regulator [Chloroflexota bacterium]TMD74528.1 MAG: helix-turn-helix transcriptional regulator [Chloroflexota bacterium]